MNLLGKKSNGQLITWEPFATSTPLKPFSINQKPKNGICPLKPRNFPLDSTEKRLDISKIFQNNQAAKSKIKITGRNRSRAYFDLSSSSDDSDDEQIERNRPMIKINKGSTERVKLFPLYGRCSNEIKKSKSNSGEFQVTENKAENRSATSNSDLENIDISANIPDSDNNIKNTKCTRSRMNKKVDKAVNTQAGKKSILIVNNENNIRKPIQNSSERKDTECKAANNVKKRKVVETDSTENHQILKKSAKLKNSSHQLFTDTTQEELINTLCLITPEADELVANLSKGNFQSNTNVGKTQSSKTTIGKSINDEKQRSKRTRQAPKKYWMVEDKPECLKRKVKGTRIPRKKQATQSEPLNVQVDPPLPAEKLTLKKENPNYGDDKIIDNQKESKTERTGPSDSQQTNRPPAEHENITDYPIFLPLNQVSCIKNEFGNEIGRVYNLGDFKCGISKMKPGMVFKRKKSQRNIYMGSVVIKGDVKMKIGGKESNLKEGDMAFVPPLTEWQATNTGQCESLFYYWCGKFNK